MRPRQSNKGLLLFNMVWLEASKADDNIIRIYGVGPFVLEHALYV